MTAAATWNDAEFFRQAAVVEKAKDRASRFETFAETVHTFAIMVRTNWAMLDEPRKDLLRRLAHDLIEPEASWFERQLSLFDMVWFVVRHGPDESVRQMKKYASACDEFLTAIHDAEERGNPAFAAKLEEGIADALDPNTPRTTVASKGELGEWFQRFSS